MTPFYMVRATRIKDPVFKRPPATPAEIQEPPRKRQPALLGGGGIATNNVWADRSACHIEIHGLFTDSKQPAHTAQSLFPARNIHVRRVV